MKFVFPSKSLSIYKKNVRSEKLEVRNEIMRVHLKVTEKNVNCKKWEITFFIFFKFEAGPRKTVEYVKASPNNQKTVTNSYSTRKPSIFLTRKQSPLWSAKPEKRHHSNQNLTLYYNQTIT